MDEVVGKSINRIDSLGKVTGKTKYPGDWNLPDQVYMKVLFSERPHAIIRNIKTTKAENTEGVIAVLTAKDVPVNEYGLIISDQPVLCGPGSDIKYSDRVRCVGDQIALIIAESENIAEKAKNLIEVDYEELPVITDPFIALDDNKNLIHPERDRNDFWHYKIINGDIDKAFNQSDIIVESFYKTPAQEHAYLQPESGISYIDEMDRVTVITAGQWTHEDQEQIAHSLNIPLDKVRVIYGAIGGAFGGREDMSVQIILALAAYRLNEKGINRPVKIIWSREESIIGHHKRHPYYIKTKWGALKNGKILAAKVDIVADGGAYNYTSNKVMGNATLMCTGPYDIPNVEVISKAVYTNNLPNGAFRGFGGPQAAFAAEMQINKLADKLNIDPVEIRMRNILKEGSLLSVRTPLPKGVSIPMVVESCAENSGWINGNNGWKKEKFDKNLSDNKRIGKGFACAYKNVGFSFGAPEKCTAKILIDGKDEIEKVVLYHAGADVGQGAHTVFKQMVADSVGVPIDIVEIVASDTAHTGNSGSSSASRMTFMAGNSIIGAAKAAVEKWMNEDRPAVAEYTYVPPKTTPYDEETGECMPNFSYGYVAESVDCEVDLDTGKIHVTNVVCADDVGKAINPLQVEGQIEGCIVQAHGYALLENFIQEDGEVKTKQLSTYLIPTIMDVPDNIDSLILEYDNPIGPWGARGMSEMPYMPFTPAVVSAVYDATGIWMDEFPLTPERVLKYLGKI